MPAALSRMPAVERMIAEYERELVAMIDAVAPSDARRDADGGTEIGGLLGRISAMFSGASVRRRLAASLGRRAAAGELVAQVAWRRQVEQFVAVRPRIPEATQAAVLERSGETVVARKRRRDEWVDGNVALVRSIGKDLHDQLAEVVKLAEKTGQRHEVLAKRIAERFGVARSRARLIARDQVTKHLAQVNEAQQVAAGVTRFRWRHSGSERSPRPEHVARDGKIYDWKKPPPDGPPGHAINCRCTAEPVLEDLLGPGTAARAAS